MVGKLRQLVRALRVRGVPIALERHAGSDWVRAAAFVGWALVAGAFLFVNGEATFRRESYEALRETFSNVHVVGGILFALGLLGMAGEWFGRRRWVVVFYVGSMIWHSMYFGYTAPGNLGIFGNANMVSLFALVMSVLYLIQAFEVWTVPKAQEPSS